jgi:hypothetical protein
LLSRGEFEEGSPVTCLTRAELLPSDDEIKLGEVGAAPFYVEAREYERWGRPALVVDVAPGSAGSFSLAGLEEIHFVTRTPSTTAVGA